MADTPKLVLPEISTSQASKEVTHNEALRILDAAVQLTVIDQDLTAPPGSPDDGDTYIVGAGATGDWDGYDGHIAYYSGSAWIFIYPDEGWIAYVQDENGFYICTGDSGDFWIRMGEDIPGIPVDIACMKAGQPGSSEVILRYVFTRGILFEDDFAGSQGVVGTAASDSGGVTMDVQVNGGSIGEIYFAESESTATFATDSSDIEPLTAGDILTIVAPASQDSTLADVAITLAGKVD